MREAAPQADLDRGSPESRDPQRGAGKGLFHSLSTALPPLLWTSLWLLGSLLWLAQDHVLRDGDEEGHVGAAELFAQLLHEGRWADFFTGALAGDYGEYPPLYPAGLGLAWWGLGVHDPAALPLRAVGLLVYGLAAALTGVAAAQLSPQPATARGVAALGVLLLPLGNGLARHFMPESLALFFVAALCAAVARAMRRPDGLAAALVGLVLGLGLLAKQTFALYALPLLLLAARPLRARLVGSLLLAGLIAGPWYLGHLADQAAYTQQSLEGQAPPALWARLAYYPLVLLIEAGGPALCLGALLSLADRAPARRPLRHFASAALLGGMLVLALVPKKYPRLLAPLTPALALLVAASPARPLLLAGGGLYLIGASLLPLPQPDLYKEIDPRCPQDWIRPPIADDQGMAALLAALRARPPGELVVIAPPELPCAVQTTHPWIAHLPAALRRNGLDAWTLREDSVPGGTLTVDWRCGLQGEVLVPSLASGFCLGPPPGL